MSCETGGVPRPERSKGPEIDMNTRIRMANRDLEMWLGIDLNAPREDQRGYESDWQNNRQAPSFENMMATRGFVMIKREGKWYDIQDDGSYMAEDGEILPDVRTAPKEPLQKTNPLPEK